jgi:GT2 family glycosyltransferase
MVKTIRQSERTVVSVIILSYNTKDLLLACLKSVVNESRSWEQDVEIIVVDNGSADGSPEAVRESFKEVIVFENHENLGFARGNNRGIRESKGDPVIILNSDTVLMPGFFSMVDKELEGKDQVGIVAPRLLNPDGSLQVSAYHNYPDPLVEIFGYTPIGNIATRLFPGIDYPFRYAMTTEEHSVRREVSHVKGACLIVRRALLNETGGFDEDFFLYREETDLCKRADGFGWKIIYTPDIYVYHHHKASSQSFSDKGLTHRLTSHYLYLKKHHGPFAIAAAYTFFLVYSIFMVAVMTIAGMLGNTGATSRSSYYTKILEWHLKRFRSTVR